VLSLIACFSMPAAIPFYVFSQVFFDDYDWLFARRPPWQQPRVWVLGSIIGLLAVDLALVSLLIPREFGSRLLFFDATVLLGPFLFGTSRPHSVCDLWFVAMLIGLLGTLAIPGVSAR
jgi:hypothetical protein